MKRSTAAHNYGEKVIKALPLHILGVDFSGAKHAGKKIWIAIGKRNPSGLTINKCVRVSDMERGAKTTDAAMCALGQCVLRHSPCVVGFDFPFSLPAEFIREPNWIAFLRNFAQTHTNADSFRSHCAAMANGHERKRKTDTAQRTPFSPYNLRLFKQTYYGVRDVLRPLVLEHGCSAPPMAPAKQPLGNTTILLEVCPASTLRAEGLDRPYKMKNAEGLDARCQLFEALLRRKLVSAASPDVRNVCVQDSEGDALDSVIAAAAAFRAKSESLTQALPPNAPERLEGRVFV